MEFLKGVAYTGLCDAWGGKMWFCIEPGKAESAYFSTKKECGQFIRKSFTGNDRKFLLGKLKERKGRAFWYA